MEKKLEASFQFYYYLLSTKNKYFTIHQKQILLKKLNNSYFHKKKNFRNFFKLTFLYVIHFSIKEYVLFLKLLWIKIRQNETRR